MSKDDDFSEWATNAAPALLRLARVLLTHESRDAEDLVQDALVAVYVKWSRVENVDAFARRCLTNKFISSRRAQVRRGEELWADVPEERSIDSERSSGSPWEALSLLTDLPRQQRAVVALRYLDDMSFEQIADVLEISEGTVKKHLSRALGALRRSDLQHDTSEGNTRK